MHTCIAAQWQARYYYFLNPSFKKKLIGKYFLHQITDSDVKFDVESEFASSKFINQLETKLFGIIALDCGLSPVSLPQNSNNVSKF